MAASDVANVGQAVSPRRQNWQSAAPEASEKTCHHRAFVVFRANQITRIHQDDIAVRLPERHFLGGSLGAHVIDADALEIESALFVEDFALSARADSDDA